MSKKADVITLPVRRVKYTEGFGYKVQQKIAGGWVNVSKDYGHSTSAFAALGRLTQKDSVEYIK